MVIIDEVRSDNKLGQDAAARILELEAENTKLREAETSYLLDPAIDERWNAGADFVQMQLCAVLRVNPKSVTWDAATETLDGDVQSVIGNILTRAMGDNWQDLRHAAAPGEKP